MNTLHHSFSKAKHKKGFTFIEIMVAASILALLSAAGLVSFATANKNARNSKRKTDMEQIRGVLELYRNENPSYPTAANWNSMISQVASYTTNTSSIKDPKASPFPQYTYQSPTTASGCTAYRVCATLETSPSNTSYCLCNP